MKCDIVVTTCALIFHEFLKGFSFPTVLIDECSQATEPIAILPLLKKAEHYILVGDHMQLGPTVTSCKLKDSGYEKSLFERLLSLNRENNNTHFLDVTITNII